MSQARRLYVGCEDCSAILPEDDAFLIDDSYYLCYVCVERPRPMTQRIAELGTGKGAARESLPWVTK